METLSRELRHARRELEPFHEFVLPFELSPDDMSVVANYGFPEKLLPRMKNALVRGFASETGLAEVARSFTTFMRENGPTENWLCFIRPRRLIKCCARHEVTQINLSFFRDGTEYLITVGQLL